MNRPREHLDSLLRWLGRREGARFLHPRNILIQVLKKKLFTKLSLKVESAILCQEPETLLILPIAVNILLIISNLLTIWGAVGLCQTFTKKWK